MEIYPSNFKSLLQQRNYGVLLSACSLIHYTISQIGFQHFLEIPPLLIEILKKIADYGQDYMYYLTPCPWLQIKILRILELYPPPRSQPLLEAINDIIAVTITNTIVTKNVNKNNADHSILFESINLVIHYKEAIREKIRWDVISILGKFISVREPNIRYLALDTMARLQGNPVTNYLISEHMSTILISLRDPDVSIRKRALDLLYVMCNHSSAKNIVQELLDFLQETAFQLKEDVVLKIAILAEKFAANLKWYVDVVVKIMECAGDFVSDDIWFRVAQIVTGFGSAAGNEALQHYAALKLFNSLNTAHPHETLLKLGAYVLSEYGFLISGMPGKSFEKQFELLNRHFQTCSNSARGMILTTFMKLITQSPDLKETILPIFEGYTDYWDVEIQQRAFEYMSLCNNEKFDQSKSEILEKMPNFSENLQNNNILLRRMHKMTQKKELGSDSGKEEDILPSTAFQSQISQNLQSSKGISEEEKEVIKRAKEKPATEAQEAPKEAEQKQEPPAPLTTNLLDIDEPEEERKSANPGGGLENTGIDLGSDLNNFATMSIGGPVNKHRFYLEHGSKFASEPTISPESAIKIIPHPLNGTEWKKLISTKVKEGIIYQDPSLKVLFNSEIMQFTARFILQFYSNVLLNDLEAQIRFMQTQSQNVNIHVSKFKIPEDYTTEPYQIMLQMMLDNPIEAAPVFVLSANGRSLEFALPILLNKFVEPVQLTHDKFEEIWHDITEVRPETYQKMDTILKNPAPQQIPVMDVLKKMAELFTEYFNFNVLAPQDVNNFTQLRVTGQIVFKGDEQVNFPNDPSEMINPITVPILAEIEFFPEIDKNEFRFSIRSTDTVLVASGLLSLFKFFVNPTN